MSRPAFECIIVDSLLTVHVFMGKVLDFHVAVAGL